MSNKVVLEVLTKAKYVFELYLSRNTTQKNDVQYLQQYPVNEYFSKELETDLREGLDQQGVDKNRLKYGQNKLRKKKMRSYCSFLIGQLTQEMMIILMIAASMSIILQAIYSQERSIFWIQGAAILVGVAVCSLVASINNYGQQKRFEDISAIEHSQNHYDVIRGGKLKEILVDEIVSGDIIIICAGMQIPVDGFIIHSMSLTMDESSITGESQQVLKESNNKCIRQRNNDILPSCVVLSGSKVMSGEGKMLSVVVGDESRVGILNKQVNNYQKESPLQQKLEDMGDQIGKFGGIAAILIFLILMLRLFLNKIIPYGWNTKQNLQEIVQDIIIAVSIVVVAVPQGLPLSVTLSLAYSLKKMLQHNILVRTLISCETMGEANFICTDKTGTLTQNQMSVVHFWSSKVYPLPTTTYHSFGPQFVHLLRISILHNTTAHLLPIERGSQTQIALLKLVQKITENYQEEQEQRTLSQEKYFMRIPFTSSSQKMTTGIFIENKRYVLIKGGPQVIKSSCKNILTPQNQITQLNQQSFNDEVTFLTNKGLRIVCIAYKQLQQLQQPSLQDSNFSLLCILGIQDLVRQQSHKALQQCQDAGITVIMVTGDNPQTAKNIATQVGILHTGQQNYKQSCMLGSQLQTLIKHQSDENLETIFERLKVVSRCTPQHKYMLVKSLKKLKNVVAVTGNGTNDVPALKKADVGFAMGISGSQVAKNASDIIILDDNFECIVEAVVWGRNIYDSISKFLQFQLTTNLVTVGLGLVSSALIMQSVLTALQMLWVQLIMDSLASLALATEPPNPQQLLYRKPHSRRQSLLSSRMIKHIIGQTIYQLSILILILFFGHLYIPQYQDDFDRIIGNDLSAKYHNGIIDGTIVNGCFYNVNGSNAYFTEFQKYYIYTRHFTFIYNTFVMMQVFNFFSCRKIHDQLNIFQGLTANWIYNFVVLFILIIQILIIEVGNVPFKLYAYGGLTIQQWILSVIIAISVIPLSIILRLIPYGKQATQEVQQNQSSSSNSSQ